MVKRTRKQFRRLFRQFCLILLLIPSITQGVSALAVSNTESSAIPESQTQMTSSSLNEGSSEELSQMQTTDSSLTEDSSESPSLNVLAEGSFGTSHWELSDNHVLKISAGQFADTEGVSPWIAYKDEIEKIQIEGEVTLGKESSHLFQDLSELVEIDSIENFKITEPTMMNSFFEGCGELKEVDFSKWDTKEIVENDNFFNECEKLETIELGPHSVFKDYEDEKRQELEQQEKTVQEKPASIWKGKMSEKVFPSIPELLSKNEGTADVFSKELAPKESEITVKYLNENDKEIHESKKLSGKIGESYDLESEEYQIQIAGYVIDDTKLPETKGTFQEENPAIIFHYKKAASRTARAKRAVETPNVLYRSYVQSDWQDFKKNGEASGTSGQNIQAVEIKLEDMGETSGIEYRTAVQNTGWEKQFTSDGKTSGVSGGGKKLLAIQIQLTGEIASTYDVFYRVTSETFGELGWAKNGESAGTELPSFGLQSIEVRLVKKGSNELVSSPKAFVKTPSVAYRSHVQNTGWQNYVKNGQPSGTSGQRKRLEGIQIRLEENKSLNGSIQYRTHIQDIGWESSFKQNDALSGTTGKAKRLEAIQIKLTGDIAKYFDVYYRVHAQNLGWQGWAKNGGSAGTAGMAYRLEAIEIKVVEKGAAAPGVTTGTFYNKPSMTYQTHVQNIGWQGYKGEGATSGTSGQSKRLEAIKIQLTNQAFNGSIQYRTHIQNIGWESSFKTNNAISGTTGQAKRLEAIQIRLTGDMSKYFDVYYRVHAQNFGWLDWAKNGQSAGTITLALRLEAVQIVLRRKDQGAPGATSVPFIERKEHLFVMGHGVWDPGASGSGTNERDFTRNEFLPYLRKYASRLKYTRVVFYDTKRDMYQDSRAGKGAYSIVRSMSSVTELHLDAPGGTGGHVIVNKQGRSATNLNLGSVIRRYVGLNRNYSSAGGLSYRNDLLNLNVFDYRGIDYRLIEMGFITNSGDVARIRQNKDRIAKEMIENVTGEKL